MAEIGSATQTGMPMMGIDAAGVTKMLSLDAAGGIAASALPGGATAINGASGTVAAAAAAATLAAAAGKTTYITGFEITSAGATAASVVAVSVVGVVNGPLTYTYASVAGAAVGNQPLIVQFSAPIPASAVNTAITVTLPSLGAGNTNATVTAHGFQI